MENFKFIKFWNDYVYDYYDGYLIKEDNKKFYMVHPITYEWMKHSDTFHWLNTISLEKYDKSLFFYAEVRPKKYTQGHEWIFDFELFDEDFKKIERIVSFFDCFIFHHKMPFSKRLEQTILRTSYHIDKSTLSRLVQFTITREMYIKEKLRLMFSPTIRPFLEEDFYK